MGLFFLLPTLSLPMGNTTSLKMAIQFSEIWRPSRKRIVGYYSYKTKIEYVLQIQNK